MSLHSLASRMAKHITEGTGMEPERVDRVRYGLEIILGTIIKGTILLTAAHLLKILPQVSTALACGSLLRLVSGGAHCTGYLRCLTCGLVVYLSAGKAALYFENFLTSGQLATILPPCFLAMALCACLWAPAEVPNRMMNFNETILFKSLTVVFLAAAMSVFFLLAGRVRLSFIMAGLLALLAQTFSFSPPGYLVIGKIDTFLSNITLKKGGATNNAEN